ncbi:MAG: hypothetical protein GY805_34125 [Chloroflexi bacterium]|nr:hypothetical protein [Chloroflexota bacterium]
MWFETLIREETECATYMIGCQQTGECAVFDPLWGIQLYLDMAIKKKSKICYVIDSQSHANHVSGATWLAEAADFKIIDGDGNICKI